MKEQNKIGRYIIGMLIIFAAAQAHASLPAILLLMYMVIHIM